MNQLSRKEVAEALGISEYYVAKLVEDGHLSEIANEKHMHRKHRKFRLSDVRDYMITQKYPQIKLDLLLTRDYAPQTISILDVYTLGGVVSRCNSPDEISQELLDLQKCLPWALAVRARYETSRYPTMSMEAAHRIIRECLCDMFKGCSITRYRPRVRV